MREMGRAKTQESVTIWAFQTTLFHYEMLKCFSLIFLLNFVIALAMVSVFFDMPVYLRVLF